MLLAYFAFIVFESFANMMIVADDAYREVKAEERRTHHHLDGEVKPPVRRGPRTGFYFGGCNSPPL
jgi:hypothetical protein